MWAADSAPRTITSTLKKTERTKENLIDCKTNVQRLYKCSIHHKNMSEKNSIPKDVTQVHPLD